MPLYVRFIAQCADLRVFAHLAGMTRGISLRSPPSAEQFVDLGSHGFGPQSAKAISSWVRWRGPNNRIETHCSSAQAWLLLWRMPAGTPP